MKILFICENYIPHYGGAEVVFKNLAEGYVKLGHEVTILTHQLKNTKKREIINGVKVIRVPSLNSRYLFSFTSLIKAIKLSKKHDIIQTTTFNGAPPAWFASKITKKPVIITIHEVWVNKWKKVTNFPWWKAKIHNLLEKIIYLLPYDKYVCVSEATKIDLLKIGIKKNKVKRIYNGLNYDFWNIDNYNNEDEIKKIKNNLQLKGEFIYFSWGRPGESKGFEYLLKAVPLIKNHIPNSKLILMLGSINKYKDKHKQLIKIIKKLKIENSVEIIPSVKHEKLGYYIKLANCIVVPSIAEGFGYTTVESVAMKKSIVVSDAGSLPEVVSGNYQIFKNKDHKDLANKVIKIANDDYKKKPIKRFEWNESIKEYLREYNSLITNKNLK